jgi:hypothetical protein
VIVGLRLVDALRLIFAGIPYVGHREVGRTECPGLDVRQRFALQRMGR